MTWVENNAAAEGAICNIEVIQQFTSWLCDFARKSNGALGTVRDVDPKNLARCPFFFNLHSRHFLITALSHNIWLTDCYTTHIQRYVRAHCLSYALLATTLATFPS